MEPIPSRVPCVLPAVRPSRVGADSHEVSRPFGGFPLTSPVCDGSSRPSRFRSQVLSTSQRFPGRSELRGLVSCRRPPLGFNPSEPSSSPRSRTPLEAASSLAVLHRLSSSASLAAHPRSSAGPRGPSPPAVGPRGLPAGLDVIARGLSLRVSPTPVHECTVAWLPAGATSVVSTGSRACAPTGFPAALDHVRLRRAHDNTGFGCPEAFIPPRSRTPSSPKRHPWPLLSWASASPEPCSDRASGPLTLRTVPFAAG